MSELLIIGLLFLSALLMKFSPKISGLLDFMILFIVIFSRVVPGNYKDIDIALIVYSSFAGFSLLFGERIFKKSNI